MGNIVTMASRGMTRYYANQVNAGQGVVLAVLLKAGQEADSSLHARDTLAAVLGVTANKEPDWTAGTPYVRKAYSQVVVSAQPTASRVDFDLATDPTWAVAGGSAAPMQMGKVGLCWAATANAANGAVVPLVWMDFPYWADGSDLVATLDAAGWYRT